MDLTTIIVAIVLVALCIIPMVLLNRSGKKNNHQDEK